MNNLKIKSIKECLDIVCEEYKDVIESHGMDYYDCQDKAAEIFAEQFNARNARILSVLHNVGQLIQGWNATEAEWSSWDKEVFESVCSLIAELHEPKSEQETGKTSRRIKIENSNAYIEGKLEGEIEDLQIMSEAKSLTIASQAKEIARLKGEIDYVIKQERVDLKSWSDTCDKKNSEIENLRKELHKERDSNHWAENSMGNAINAWSDKVEGLRKEIDSLRLDINTVVSRGLSKEEIDRLADNFVSEYFYPDIQAKGKCEQSDDMENFVQNWLTHKFIGSSVGINIEDLDDAIDDAMDSIQSNLNVHVYADGSTKVDLYTSEAKRILSLYMRGQSQKIDRQMLAFAETCMINLLSTKPETSQLSEISSLDLHRIKQVLNKFRK